MVAFFSMLSPFSPCSCSGDAAARRRRAAAAGTRNGARACAARWRGARALRALRAPAARRPLLRRRSGRRGTAARRRRRRNGGSTATAARDGGADSSSGGATRRRSAAATAAATAARAAGVPAARMAHTEHVYERRCRRRPRRYATLATSLATISSTAAARQQHPPTLRCSPRSAAAAAPQPHALADAASLAALGSGRLAAVLADAAPLAPRLLEQVRATALTRRS